MFLKELEIYNFRKFKEKENGDPGLLIKFNKNFNLIIGENDSGKTAIIDAIRLTLGTMSMDNPRISEEDFYSDQQSSVDYFRIECLFTDLSAQEAGVYLEWLSFNGCGEYELQVRLDVRKVKNGYIANRFERSIKAGPKNADLNLDGTARELLKTTYLKPLRDAESELRPGLKSRLAQILQGHSAFKVNEGELHVLEDILSGANKQIEEYFDSKTSHQEESIREELISYLNEFFPKTQDSHNPSFEVSPAKLNTILRKLALTLEENISGLGSLNLLFIAAELLLLNNRETLGPSLTLIEEIEAHLHPQAQLRLVKYLQETLLKEHSNGQFILTTHSTSLAASVSLKHLILMHNGFAYPLSEEHTKLDIDDYRFLERFLDVTKSNLFFAKGVILVEGDAENLLIPAIAEAIGRPLHKYGVSIVNLGSTAFKRYSKIFSRSQNWYDLGFPSLNLPVSLITDSDIKPFEYYSEENKDFFEYLIESQDHLLEILNECGIDDKFSYEDLNITSFQKVSDLKKALHEAFDLDEASIIDNVLEKSTKKQIKAEYITQLEEDRIKSLKEKYENDANLKVFVAQHWTLEFMLALSSLKKHLATAIHESRYKHPYNTTNKQKLDSIVGLISDKEVEQKKVGYLIFKPLNEKVVSKALVAQELASLIYNEKEALGQTISSDPFLKYIVDAIYNVTEPR
ncbi:hypothetical protein JCM9140_323 [Halalkalibacter wakoensis JCM 9140]|uniref:Uncharacterized protein n=1 Tax=Halalkalibacter wakoensis JCM 9140 TaxID=1236970 RepID=W4PY65_9BACI|nr:AAA family ATPase [Halalkalibacter wakoensis]GAE24403.1 hypothetical protein JCM9140_323 [Halalkalibacter wakoensis JCM 9140]